MAIRFYHEFVDRANYLNEIEISADSWGGGPSLITHSSGIPIITRHAGEKAGRNIIKGREVQFEFFVFPEDMDRYDDIFVSDYGDYKIRHWVAGELIFEGWLLPDNLSREYFKDKYVISLSATDGLAKLQNVSFLASDDTIIEGVIYQLEALKYAIDKIGLGLDFRIQLGTYESALMSADQCALAVIGCDTRRFYPGGKPMTCGQVIEAILKPYSCTLMQQDGYWQITNKQEGDSMQFVFNYASLGQVSRTGTSKIVDLAGYWYEKAVMSKIGPLRDFGISFYNRDLGEDITGLDLTDWNGEWTHTFDSLSVDAGTAHLESGVNYPGDYIEPSTDFAVPYVFPFNSTDYFHVSFDYYIETHTATRPNPILLISVKRPDGSYTDGLFIYLQTDRWVHYDSGLHPKLRLLSAGDHNLRFTFDHDEDTDPGLFHFLLRNVNISITQNPNQDVDVDVNVSQDEYYRQTTGRNLEIVEEISLFADGTKVTETGALLHNLTTLTTAWNTYGGGEGISLLDIWARNELNNRYRFKDYLSLNVHDLNNNIDIDSILSIDGNYYTVVKYYKDHKKCIIEADIEELLLTKNAYSPITQFALTSIEGEPTSTTSQSPSSEVGVHNYLIGIQGGIDNDHFHLLEAEHTELTAWLDNVILSDAGGIDMDGTLAVDTLVEHTLDNGIDIDLINISDAAITTAEADLTFEDGTTGPVTLTELISGSPHTHGNITNDGAIGSTADLPVITTGSGILTVSSFGTSGTTFCEGNDSRLSDSRTPTAHASSHQTGGGDLVNHDSLTGFVAAEHYSHTSISMGTASTSGLNGGGTIAATRALVLAVNRLTARTTLQAADYFPFYDDSGAGTRRISYANMITALNSDLSFYWDRDGTVLSPKNAGDDVELDGDIYLNTNSGVSHVDRTIYFGDTGDWDTYIAETTDDYLDIYAASTQIIQFRSSIMYAYKGLSFQGVGDPYSVWNDGNVQYFSAVYSNTTANCLVAYTKYGGTHASPTAAPTDTKIVEFIGRVHDGTSQLQVAVIQFKVDGSVSTGNVSGEINFYTRQTTGSITERMTLTANGTLQVNSIGAGADIAKFDSTSTTFTSVLIDGGSGCDTLLTFQDNGTDGASIGWDAGTNTLKILKGGSAVHTDLELLAEFDPDAACKFYWNNILSIETMLGGVKITGRLLVDKDIHAGGTASEALKLEIDGPSVTTNTTNYDRGLTLDQNHNYDIQSGYTDSGYRMGMNILVASYEADFLGTLTNQYGIRIQYGHYGSSGVGVITNAYGLYLDYLTDGASTITNVYSIYSAGEAPMYHLGNVGIGILPDAAIPLIVARDQGANLWDNQLTMIDTNNDLSVGTGGGMSFQGYYTTTVLTTGGFIKISKRTPETGYYAYDMHFGVREEGESPATEMELGYDGLAIYESLCVGLSTGMHSYVVYPSKFFVTHNDANAYAAYFQNQNTESTSWGIAIECGTTTEDADYIRFYDNNVTYCGKIYSTTSSDISLVGSSDKRLKTEIRATEINAAGILSMPIEDFKMKSQIGTAKEMFLTGYVAQHIQDFYPEMVLFDTKEDVFMVDKLKLIPVLHRGWQLHEEKIKRLEGQIVELQTKIKQHETEIKRLG